MNHQLIIMLLELVHSCWLILGSTYVQQSRWWL
jgi:hypothetical protein